MAIFRWFGFPWLHTVKRTLSKARVVESRGLSNHCCDTRQSPPFYGCGSKFNQVLVHVATRASHFGGCPMFYTSFFVWLGFPAKGGWFGSFLTQAPLRFSFVSRQAHVPGLEPQHRPGLLRARRAVAGEGSLPLLALEGPACSWVVGFPFPPPRAPVFCTLLLGFAPAASQGLPKVFGLGIGFCSGSARLISFPSKVLGLGYNLYKNLKAHTNNEATKQPSNQATNQPTKARGNWKTPMFLQIQRGAWIFIPSS